MNESPLRPIIADEVQLIRRQITQEAVDPWKFFNVQGIHIKKINSTKEINISGVEFSGSVLRVFWGDYIDEYIEFYSKEVIEKVRLKAIDRSIDLECALKDCYMYLEDMVSGIYRQLSTIEKALKYSDGSQYRRPLSLDEIPEIAKTKTSKNLKYIEQIINSEILAAQNKNMRKFSWNKLINIKPGFFGLGLDINYLISWKKNK